MNKPIIFIITKEIDLYHTFRDKIHEIFGGEVQLRSNHFPPVDLEEVDLILSSGAEEIYRDIVDTSKVKAPLVVANRSIDFNKLEILFELPVGTKCLLVSNTKEVVYESMSMLERLGFDYLDFTPYSPDMDVIPDVCQIDVAVTHGLKDLVHEGVQRVIDLENRSLDLSTLFEIAKILKQPFDQSRHMTMDYVKNFVRIGRELAQSVQNELEMNSYLESVLDAAQEGIIFINADGKITVFNEEASSILGLDGQASLGKNYTEVLRDFPIEQVMAKKEPFPRQMIRFQGLNILTTMKPLLQDGTFTGAVLTFQDVTYVQRMEQEIRKKKLDTGMTTKYTFDDIIGHSDLMRETRNLAKKLARNDYTVLIMGESGTGKEIFAQAIHEHSSRRSGPFVAVNFAGITQSLAESELFGYEEGAFTGASRGGKAGLFELAQNGTIFLDEIGDAPLKIQAAILRVLQEKQVMRVGGNKMIPVNVRVIAATNKPLYDIIKEGTFREDLYYRLNQLPLEIPPLRNRKEDIQDLAECFLQKNQIHMRFTPEVFDRLSVYHWPGNVRELEGLLTYLSVTVDGVEPSVQNLPRHLTIKNENTSDVNKVMKLLEQAGDKRIFKEILQCLSLYQGGKSGIGRVRLKAMMDQPITEGQLRTKLEILKKCECVLTGAKKQGTSITEFGKQVLTQL
ncbi:sigma 54-interacting transcriptional regulator [Salinibacillus aidingensis]|uniref:Sigma 54-interacting transcriptional regulator n=1 Tax=Salinibacillus aidingensis TaxID=237684 RepID=A0ABP3KRQ5_9BACI